MFILSRSFYGEIIVLSGNFRIMYKILKVPNNGIIELDLQLKLYLKWFFKIFPLSVSGNYQENSLKEIIGNRHDPMISLTKHTVCS